MRVRITAAVSLLVAAALSGAGLIVYTIEAQRAESEVGQQFRQELDEFTRLTEAGVDPRTRQPFTSAERLLGLFLQRNVPGNNEVLLGYVPGRPLLGADRSALAAVLTADPTFGETAQRLAQSGGDETVGTAEVGDVRLVAQDVSIGEDSSGALVVAILLDRGRAADLLETMRTYTVVALFAWLAITMLAGWQSSRLLAPLHRLRTTAEAITESDLSQRLPETGNDDITALTRTFNRMVARLEAAFTEQRTFLDDIGHELRTPLTVLRGNLELLDGSSPDEVAGTRELLLDEIDRMSRLVGDLTLLAKSRRPDFLTIEPVELGRLTDTLLAKARGLADRDWRFDGGDSAVVPMDEQRITQAVLQLADNAVKHTRPGDVVAVGSSYDGRRAEIWVRDNGAGIAPEDRQRIFERFGRGQVAPDDEGFGLGLSIVDAIARAHGGRVDVEDAEPHGAVFVISLPVVARLEDEETWRAS